MGLSGWVVFTLYIYYRPSRHFARDHLLPSYFTTLSGLGPVFTSYHFIICPHSDLGTSASLLPSDHRTASSGLSWWHLVTSAPAGFLPWRHLAFTVREQTRAPLWFPVHELTSDGGMWGGWWPGVVMGWESCDMMCDYQWLVSSSVGYIYNSSQVSLLDHLTYQALFLASTFRFVKLSLFPSWSRPFPTEDMCLRDNPIECLYSFQSYCIMFWVYKH